MSTERKDGGPAPGSDEALKLGCKCPVLDNAHGKGYPGNPGVYVHTEDCPVHNAEYLAARGASHA